MKIPFSLVDTAVAEALKNRVSPFDDTDSYDWTDDVLRAEASHVRATIKEAVEKTGWSFEEYTSKYRKLRRNRHTPATAGY